MFVVYDKTKNSCFTGIATNNKQILVSKVAPVKQPTPATRGVNPTSNKSSTNSVTNQQIEELTNQVSSNFIVDIEILNFNYIIVSFRSWTCD
jgi:hypothetical protein